MGKPHKKDPGPSPDDPLRASPDWECRCCTLLNNAATRRCIVCNTHKERQARIPANVRVNPIQAPKSVKIDRSTIPDSSERDNAGPPAPKIRKQHPSSCEANRNRPGSDESISREDLDGRRRRATGAALARSALADLRPLKWDDIAVDWCPREHLDESEAKTCGLLGISTLRKDSRGARGPKPKDLISDEVGVHNVTCPSINMCTAGPVTEVRMNELFPLPRPERRRYVKSGVYFCVDSSSESGGPKTASTIGRSSEDEIVEVEMQKMGRSTSSGSDTLSGRGAEGVPEKRPQHSGRGSETMSDKSGGDSMLDRDIDSSDSGDAKHDTRCASTESLQSNMTQEELSKAYNAIFRHAHLKVKRRTRNPVASTPLRLPFPLTPSEVSLEPNNLHQRPPCGDSEHVQTEAGSEWAWGTLTLRDLQERGCSEGEAENKIPLHHFRLPYHLLYDVKRSKHLAEIGQQGMRSVDDAMDEFEVVTSNVHLSRKQSKEEYGSSRCKCLPPSDGGPGCAETCSNRATGEECSKHTCGLEGKATCGNRRLQKYKHSDLLKKVGMKDCGAKGIGLVAKVPITAGSLIGEYVGEVMTDDDWQDRQNEESHRQRHKYVMDLGGGEVIDASRKGTILRFVNHSCGPNAETQKWMVQGRRRIGLFATVNIAVGEEVTFDYCYVRYDKEVQQCLCGHSKCVQTLGTRRSEEDAEGGSGRGLNIGGGEASQGTGVRGSGGRASPKWQDPETGDRVRPWLHLEDAEALEKLIIRSAKSEGRLNARDKAIVSSKLLFLPRNVSKVSRARATEQLAIANQDEGNARAERNAEESSPQSEVRAAEGKRYIAQQSQGPCSTGSVSGDDIREDCGQNANPIRQDGLEFFQSGPEATRLYVLKLQAHCLVKELGMDASQVESMAAAALRYFPGTGDEAVTVNEIDSVESTEESLKAPAMFSADNGERERSSKDGDNLEAARVDGRNSPGLARTYSTDCASPAGSVRVETPSDGEATFERAEGSNSPTVMVSDDKGSAKMDDTVSNVTQDVHSPASCSESSWRRGIQGSVSSPWSSTSSATVWTTGGRSSDRVHKDRMSLNSSPVPTHHEAAKKNSVRDKSDGLRLRSRQSSRSTSPFAQHPSRGGSSERYSPESDRATRGRDNRKGRGRDCSRSRYSPSRSPLQRRHSSLSRSRDVSRSSSPGCNPYKSRRHLRSAPRRSSSRSRSWQKQRDRRSRSTSRHRRGDQDRERDGSQNQTRDNDSSTRRRWSRDSRERSTGRFGASRSPKRKGRRDSSNSRRQIHASLEHSPEGGNMRGAGRRRTQRHKNSIDSRERISSSRSRNHRRRTRNRHDVSRSPRGRMPRSRSFSPRGSPASSRHFSDQERRYGKPERSARSTSRRLSSQQSSPSPFKSSARDSGTNDNEPKVRRSQRKVRREDSYGNGSDHSSDGELSPSSSHSRAALVVHSNEDSPTSVVSGSSKRDATRRGERAVNAPVPSESDEQVDSSDVSDTEIEALQLIIDQHGSDWRRHEDIEPAELLAEVMEDVRVRAMQNRGELPPDEDSQTEAREISTLLIRGACVKLPRDIFRRIIDVFQVMILEPYYYPSDSRMVAPAFVVGPAKHAKHARELLEAFHSKIPSTHKEPTVRNVLEFSMDRVLDVRRADLADGFHKQAKSFAISPYNANAMLDKKRLSWLTSEVCRLTGATSVSASRERFTRRDGNTVCKVSITGTSRQRTEAWEIVRQVLVQYPTVESFMKQYPQPMQLAEGRGNATISGATSKPSAQKPALTSASDASSTARPRLSFGQSLMARTATASPKTPSTGKDNSTDENSPSTRISPLTGKSTSGSDASSYPEGDGGTPVAGTSSTASGQRRKLGFGQGLHSGFKAVVTPVKKANLQQDSTPHTEWEDDGWSMPSGDELPICSDESVSQEKDADSPQVGGPKQMVRNPEDRPGEANSGSKRLDTKNAQGPIGPSPGSGRSGQKHGSSQPGPSDPRTPKDRSNNVAQAGPRHGGTGRVIDPRVRRGALPNSVPATRNNYGESATSLRQVTSGHEEQKPRSSMPSPRTPRQNSSSSYDKRDEQQGRDARRSKARINSHADTRGVSHARLGSGGGPEGERRNFISSDSDSVSTSDDRSTRDRSRKKRKSAERHFSGKCDTSRERRVRHRLDRDDTSGSRRASSGASLSRGRTPSRSGSNESERNYWTPPERHERKRKNMQSRDRERKHHRKGRERRGDTRSSSTERRR